MVSGFARCGVALIAILYGSSCYSSYRDRWYQDKEVPVHATAGEARRNVVSVELRQDGADLVATATTQTMCRRTQTGKFAMRFTQEQHRNEVPLGIPSMVGVFVGGPLTVVGLVGGRDWATESGLVLLGVGVVSIAVNNFVIPQHRTLERFEPTRDGEVRWDGDFRPCPGSSRAPLANATIVFAASYQWGAQNQSFEVGTDGNGVAIARGLAAHTSGTATYCGDSSVSASVKGIAANDDPTLPDDSTIAAAAPTVGIAPTRTEYRWDLGRPGATASEEVGMNANEVGVLRECAAQGACNRCFAACTNADKQNADRCNGIDDSDKRYWCLRNATHDLDACQSHCRPFCPGPVPDTLPVPPVTASNPAPPPPPKHEVASAKPQQQTPPKQEPVKQPTPQPQQQAQPVRPQLPDEVTIGGEAADWPSPGTGEELIQQDGRASGSPLAACANARQSAYVNLGNICFAGHKPLTRYLLFAPACHCKHQYEDHYDCVVHTEAICSNQPAPQAMFGKSRPLMDEQAARQEALHDVASHECHGDRRDDVVLGCNSDPTTHAVTCFASAKCHAR